MSGCGLNFYPVKFCVFSATLYDTKKPSQKRQK